MKTLIFVLLVLNTVSLVLTPSPWWATLSSALCVAMCGFWLGQELP